MPPIDVVSPIIYAVFLWWFTTGLIMLVYHRSRTVTRWSFIGFSLAALVALVAVVVTRQWDGLRGVYVGLTGGLVLWGWQVASYYLGFITGDYHTSLQLPLTTHRQMPQAPLAERFWLAFRASLHHELASLVGAIVLLALTWNQPNQWALWSYVALWAMHVSAKLNVFFGVRNFRIEFLPHHMHGLGALLTRDDDGNVFFPFSVMTATSIILVLIYRGVALPLDAAHTSGTLAIATLMLLGVMEHWLLVLPVPVALWGWGVRSLPDQPPRSSQKSPPTRLHAKQVVEPVKGQPQ